MSQATPTLIERLSERVLQKHGGTSDPWQHQWNLTDADSLLHKDAAVEIERLTSALASVTERLEGALAVIARHDLCHNLHGKVDAAAFADGCAAEQRKLYGCAPDADLVASLTQERNELLATLEGASETEQWHQEILDVFAQNSGDYEPTQAEVEIVNGSVESILRQVRATAAKPWFKRHLQSLRLVASLSGALRDVFTLIDSGYLVRDTSHDHEPGWALKQIEPARKLGKAHAALSAIPEPKGES